MQVLQAKVKSVSSGDTLILVNPNNPSLERTLSLAYVSAPRLRREGDEPFAYESREYLRSLSVGKIVRFRVLYNPTGKREYGTVQLEGQDPLPDAAVAAGWLKLRDDAGRKDESDESKAILEKLEAAQEKAKAESRGVWSSEGGKLETAYEIPDMQSFVEQWKGKPIDAVVERVVTGDRMIIRLLLSKTKHVQTMVIVAGIRAPTTKRTIDGKEQPAEPFGTEAQQFVERRLLQRKVKVDVVGTTPQGQLVCVVNHPNGSIAKFVLEAGLAKCTDHHSTMLGSQMPLLRQAEKAAKDKQLGVFQGATNAKGGGTQTDETVTRVQAADTVYLRGRSGEEKRVQLSSIRQPKPTDPKQGPFQQEAKEFLRKKLIGKHVKVTVDGKKAASEGFEERDVVTILVNNKNVALQMVEAGYASVIRHRRDDGKSCQPNFPNDDRSPAYDELLAAEETAKTELKGIWSEKPPSAMNYQDYSVSVSKATPIFTTLQHKKRIPAIVDYVKSGSRFTALIPRENAKITFVLSCIRAPRSARSATDKADPFGQEAHDFANRRCMQRDVEIEVEAMDKSGGFIGSMYVNRENFAKLLLEEGFASVHAFSAEKSNNGNELFAAEEKAKAAKKGMWHDYDPSINDGMDDLSLAEPSTNGTADTATAPTKKDYRDVMITHIDPATAHLKLQLIGSRTSGALTELMSAFAKYHRSPPSTEKTLPNPPKAGDFVAAKFSVDGEWYRARIRRNDREAKKADVLFIDYGNSETLPWSELRPLSQSQFSIQKLRGQASDAAFSFLQFPTMNNYLADACAFVEQVTADRQLVASVDAEEKDGTLWITLFDAEKEGGEDASVNAEVVGEGMAMVSRKPKGWEKAKGKVLESLKVKEGEAREKNLGMWEYGDVTEDD